jgi:hypothetical protein
MNVDGAWIVETTDTLNGAEMMIERPVLLHEDDDVLNVADATCAVVRGYFESLRNARLERAGYGTHAEHLQKFAAISILHVIAPIHSI